MSVETLLSPLEGVRQTGSDRWIARCPGHEDRSPSLTIRAMSDGRVLVHCHAGCSIHEVLEGAGLQFDALFPDRGGRHHRLAPVRRPFNAADILKTMAFEALTVQMIASSMRRGLLSDGSRKRLQQAVSRLMAAEENANAI